MLHRLGKPLNRPDNEPIRSLGDLIFAAHHAAKLRGEWPIDGRPLVDSLNRLHSEISEGWRQARLNKFATYYETTFRFANLSQICRPLGFWMQIAHAAIGLADLCGGEAWHPVEEEFDDVRVDLRSAAEVIHASHERLVDLGQMPNKNIVASQLFALWFVAAGLADVDLWMVIDELLKFQAETK